VTSTFCSANPWIEPQSPNKGEVTSTRPFGCRFCPDIKVKPNEIASVKPNYLLLNRSIWLQGCIK